MKRVLILSIIFSKLMINSGVCADDILYGAQFLGGGVTTFGTIDPSNGNFTTISNLPNGLGWPLGDMVSQTDPINGLIFSNQSGILAIKKSNGSYTQYNPVNYTAIVGFDITNNKIIYDNLTSGNASLYTYDTSSGTSTLLAANIATSASGFWQAGGIGAVNSYAREAYLYDSSGNKIFVTNLDTGATKNPISVSLPFLQISLDEKNQKIIGLCSTISGLRLGIIDLATGNQSYIGGIIGSTSSNYVGTVSSDNSYYYFQSGSNITVVSTKTGSVVGTFNAPSRLFPLPQVTLGGSSDSTFANSITDQTASLNKIGKNTVTISGTNYFKGDTNIVEGALSISKEDNIGSSNYINMNEGTRIYITKTGTYTNKVKLNGDPYFNISPNQIVTWTGTISDGLIPGDIIIEGGGTLNLTNTNTYTGPTTINTGSTLALTGTNASISTSNGVTNNGIFNIAGASNTVNVLSYIQTSTGNLILAATPTIFQKLAVTGSALLAGTLTLNASSGSYTAGRYILLNTTGTVTGKFDTFVNNLSTVTPLYYLLGYSSSQVYLDLSARKFDPDAGNTMISLTNNSNHVRDVLTQRAAAITNTMDYDCNAFDKQNICVSFQARYTGFESMSDGAGVMTAAYRIDPNYRMGAFIDQRATQGKKTGISYSGDMPTVGAFIGYTQQPNGTGLQAKLAVSGNTGKITATRDASLTNTEAGYGKSSLNSWAVGGELGWGMMVGNMMIATPYVGLRYSDVTRGSYTETTTADVTSPLSYASFYQRQATSTAGLRFAGQLTDAIGYQASAGAEYDIGRNANRYSGTSTITGLETFSANTNTTINRARANASVGLSYAIDMKQKITTSVSVRQQAYSSQPSVTTMAGYQISF